MSDVLPIPTPPDGVGALQVQHVEALTMSEREGVIAMLAGSALPGVGPVTAARLADHFGAELQAVMDSQAAASMLCRVKGIGSKTALKIKQAWDSSKGEGFQGVGSLFASMMTQV